jgi:hypothetical protein
MPRSESAWPAANALVGWPSPTRPRGPCWPPRFPPQGRWQNVPTTTIRDMFRRTFTRWGLPEAVRVDNGYPWGSPRDLPTELALWLIGLGVAVIWNPPAQPRKNPKVERCQGVAAAWAEPQACADPAALSAHLDWVGRVQCQEYPSIGGSTRVEAYPGLLIARRAYQESQEPTLWELGRVDRWLSPRTWNRRVDQNGVISIYGHHHWVGRVYRGQDMTVRYDGLARQWVVRDQTGEVAWRFEARELSREAILGLAVSRKRGRRQKS